MTPWLPPGSDDDVARAIATAISDWLGKWLTRVPRLEARKIRPGAHDAEHWWGTGTARVGIPAQSAVLLGNAALGEIADVQGGRDREVLMQLSAEIASDLASRLASLTSASDVQSSTLGYWRLSPDGEQWAIIAGLDPAALVRIRRRAAGTSGAKALGHMLAALSSESVVLGCHLGSAEVTAGDLGTLAAGDVIMLNRPCAAAVPLTINGEIAPSGSARISARDDGIHVALTAPVKIKKD